MEANMSEKEKEMNEASALIAWGRQVLANRRLQRQRERLAERNQINDSSQLTNLSSVDCSELSRSPAEYVNQAVAALPIKEEQMRRKEQQHCTAVNNVGCLMSSSVYRRNGSSSSGLGVVDVAQLRQRVEVAKRSVQELKEMEKHNEKAFWQRKGELQRMLEESRGHRCGDHSVAGSSVNEYATREDAALGMGVMSSLPRSSPRQQQQQWGRKEQLGELLRLQKALVDAMQNEKVAGAAVATLTACASKVQDWDKRIWDLLRESMHNWKLQLMPFLRRFYAFVQNLPVLSLPPLLQLKEKEEINGVGLKALPQGQCGERDSAANISTDVTEGGVMLPSENSYPLLEWLEKLPVQRAISVVIDALVKAGSETSGSLSSILSLLDERDAQLVNVLEEAERQLKQQEDIMDQTHDLLRRLQSDKRVLETEGVALDDDVEKLQQKVVSLKLQHEQGEMLEKELDDELQKNHVLIHELRQKIEKETSLKNDALRQTDEHKHLAESAVRQKAIIEDELQRARVKRESVELEVLQLRHAAHIAKEEENDATEQRKRQSDELRVAQSSLDTIKEAFMQRKQQHEEDQAAFVSIRCREHELQSQILAAEEACQKLLAEVEIQRGAESAARHELATIHSEMAELQKEVTKARQSLHHTNEKLEAAQMELLYGKERAVSVSNGQPPVPPSSSSSILSSQSLAEVLHQQSRKEQSEIKSAPVMISPRPRSEAAEVMLTPRGVQREQEELHMARLRLIKGHRYQEKKQHHQQQRVEILHSTLHHRESSLTYSDKKDSYRNVPLVVTQPSQRGKSVPIAYSSF